MLLKVVALLIFAGSVFCYHVVLERTEQVFASEKHLGYASFYIKRYGRRSPYLLNIEGINKHTWGNNVTLEFNIHEKLSNMYKPSFINFRFGLCVLISNDHIFGTMLRNSGLTCPVLPGEHKMNNMTVVMEDFPNVFPFEKGRAEVLAEITATKELIYKGYVYFSLVRSKGETISKGLH